MLSPFFLFNTWQGDSVPWDGMAMGTTGSQRAAHLSVQFDAMCAHKVPLICRVRTHCADDGNVLGLFQVSWNSLKFLSCRKYGRMSGAVTSITILVMED